MDVDQGCRLPEGHLPKPLVSPGSRSMLLSLFDAAEGAYSSSSSGIRLSASSTDMPCATSSPTRLATFRLNSSAYRV